LFFGLFSSVLGFQFSHPHPDSPSFLKLFFSESWLGDPVQWPVGPFYLSLPSWLKPYGTVYSYVK